MNGVGRHFFGKVLYFRRSVLGVVADVEYQVETIFTVLQRQGGIAAAHDDEAGSFTQLFVAGLKGHFGVDREAACREFLQQKVGNLVVVAGIFGQLVREETQILFPGIYEGPGVFGVGVPLPLQTQFHAVEFIAVGGCHNGMAAAYIGLAVLAHGFANAVVVGVDANQWPAIFPIYGIQVRDAAVFNGVLKMNEPVLAGRGIDPAALVGTVDVGVSLVHYGAVFIGPVNVFAAQHFLPAVGHSSGRCKNVIVALVLVKLGSLNGFVRLVPVKNDFSFIQKVGAVGVHLGNYQNALDAGTTACIGVHQVGASVFIPKGGRVYEALAFFYQMRQTPGTFRVAGLEHIDAEVGVAIVDVELPFVVAERGRPYAIPVLGFGIMFKRVLTRQGMANQLPVYQVFGMQNGKARRNIKAGGRHVKIVAHPYHIRVGVVGIQNRVYIGAVALIGHPDL